MPHWDKLDKLVEMGNELLVMIMIYHQLILNYSIDENIKYNIGFSYISTIGLLVLFNFSVIGRSIAKKGTRHALLGGNISMK